MYMTGCQSDGPVGPRPLHDPTLADKENLRKAVLFNPPEDVLRALEESLAHHRRTQADNVRHYRGQRDDACEDKRKEGKRAETAELWRNIWCGVACVGWLALLYLIYSAR